MAQKTSDRERKLIPVGRACTEVVHGFGYLLEHYQMKRVEVDMPDGLKVGPMLEVELFSILVNLVSNAVKANLAGQGKRILIKGLKVEGRTTIRVSDDGLGIRDELREELFQPLTADPDGQLYQGLRKRIADEDLAALGRGSGVGLSIVRSIAESYGGKARFINAKRPWKTCVEVVFP